MRTSTTRTIRFPNDAYGLLMKAAQARGITLNALIAELAVRYVEGGMPINGTYDRAQGPDGKVIAPAPHD